MKGKIIAILIILLLLGGGGFYLWKAKKAKEKAAAPTVKTVEVTQGDIVQSVEATGRVVSNLDVEIKCKASGEVITLPFDVSDEVKKGQLLLELDPIDENRNVKKADVSLLSSKASLQKAQSDLQISQREIGDSRKTAEVTLQTAKVKAEDTRAKFERVKQLYDKKLSSKEEYDTAATSMTQAEADVRQAQLKLDALKTQEAALELKKHSLTQARADLEQNTISLDTARQRLIETKVFAPIDGVITARSVQKGQIIASGINNVGGGTSIMTLSDLSRLFILAAVDESDIGQVQKGQIVQITADAFPEETYLGKVDRIAQQGTNASNVVTFEVRIEVIKVTKTKKSTGETGQAGGFQPGGPPPGGMADGQRPRGMWKRDGKNSSGKGPGDFRRMRRDGAGGQGAPPPPMFLSEPAGKDKGKINLKPEMTANVSIVIARASNALLVPSDAIQRINGNQFVTVVSADGKTKLRKVKTGISDTENTQIISGLKKGEKVQITETAIDSSWSNNGKSGGNNRRRSMMPMGGPPH